MTEEIEIRLVKRAVSARATLLRDQAPATCEAVWESLPLSGDVWHAKYAGNEIYTLTPPLRDRPPLENPTVTPQQGDIAYFWFPSGTIANAFIEENQLGGHDGLVDLAVFYAPKNFLLSPSLGTVACTVFARITESADAFFDACDDVWRRGFEGERLELSRVEQ